MTAAVFGVIGFISGLAALGELREDVDRTESWLLFWWVSRESFTERGWRLRNVALGSYIVTMAAAVLGMMLR